MISKIPPISKDHVDSRLTPEQCRLEELIRWLDVLHRNDHAVTTLRPSLEGIIS